MQESSRRILSIETSGRQGSAAVATEAGVAAVRQITTPMRHAAEMVPVIAELLGSQGWPAATLTDVFVSIGPGSFTGLRIGVSIARTLGWSAGTRIVAVPTMDALARNGLLASPPPQHVVTLIDAKRSQAFAAAYRLVPGGYECIIPVQMVAPSDILSHCPRPLAALGEGVLQHRRVLEEHGVTILDATLWPARAKAVFEIGLVMAQAGRYTPSGDLVPHYIRVPEPEEKWAAREKLKVENP